MRYFTYIAEQAFRTSATGERLFYRSSPWSRPYVIPDAATEQKLYWKYVWMLRIFLGALILVGQPILFTVLSILRPQFFDTPGLPYWFLAYFVVAMAVWWLLGRIIFGRDLKRLERSPVRLPLRSFYGQMAHRHSTGKLVLGLLASLAFVAAGIWMYSSSGNTFIAVLSVAFFGICTIAWGYCLYLKLTGDHLSTPPDTGDPHSHTRERKP
jgi:hypothetical protein